MHNWNAATNLQFLKYFAEIIMYSILWVWGVQMYTVHGQRHLLKIFKHVMFSAKL